MTLSMISVPYWWHATLLELLWLLGGLVALPVALANLLDANSDENVLVEISRDPTVHSRHYLMVAEAIRGRIFDRWLTVATAVLITSAGIIGCSQPNPLAGKTTLTGFVVTVVLDGIAAISAVRAVASMASRHRLNDLARGRSSVIAAELRARHLDAPDP